jgi:ParB family protein of integrating conjugative element (PFGI_1 class)
MGFSERFDYYGVGGQLLIPVGGFLLASRGTVGFDATTLDCGESTMTKKKKKATKSRSKDCTSADQESANSIGLKSMRVEISRIKSYERNPRRSKNPEFDRIKSSILTVGMDQPLLITMRPGEDEYIVQAGGNTRLQILKESFESTGDEQFRWVDCLFVEWDRESTVLLAHLRENEFRGNLTFIDKAQAVFEVKNLIAKEFGVSDISQRELERILRDHGYSVSHGLISLMDYARSVLLPLLSVALNSGLGKLQVRRIRKLERVGREIWILRDIGADAEFDEVFETLCRRYDSEDWQFEPLRQAIEVEIAEAAEVSIQVIRMEFDCRLSGREPEIPDFLVEDEATHGDFPVSLRDEPAIVSDAERQAEAITSLGPDEASSNSDTLRNELSQNLQDQDHQQDSLQIAIELPPESNNEALFRRIGIQSKERIPISLLRETACRLAQRLARRHGMGELIKPLTENGLGFLVCDVPPASIVDQLDDAMLAKITTMWWQLIAFAEVTLAPREAVLTILDAESVVGAAVRSGDGRRLIDEVSTVNPADLGQHFWRQLNYEDWCDWLCLAHNYRELHRMAQQLNTPLWSAAT